MKEIRFGIMGAGAIAGKFVQAAEATEGARVTAVSSKSMDRAGAFAERNGIPWYGSYADMLAREDVDAVYIATTHNFHKENLRMCIEAGKHVLCEKAMLLTEADAKEIFALAAEKGVFCMEAMWSRFLPTMTKAKQWIAEGRIGQIQSATAVIGFHPQFSPESRLYNPALAGGAMYDIGVYPIEWVSWLVGEPIEDCVFFRRDNPVTGVDENVAFLLRFPSCDASIQCMFTASPKEFVLVHGSEGYIELPCLNGDRRAMLYDGNRRLVDTYTMEEANGFIYELEEMLCCIRDGKITSDRMPPEVTIECARVFDRVLGTKWK